LGMAFLWWQAGNLGARTKDAEELATI
jgi:hypothetical protein